MTAEPVLVCNPCVIPLADVPRGDYSWLRSLVLEKVAGGWQLASLFVHPGKTGNHLVAVLAGQDGQGIAVAMAEVGDSFSSLTPECNQAHLFEREIFELHGITPAGHPWLKPVRQTVADAKGEPVSVDYYRVAGAEVHEVAVGPVHAGVIEPGHFRFQCHGEKVFHLEISLGYQHRGVEGKLVGGPDARSRHLLETVAGDTTCGHANTYAMLVEALAGIEVAEEANRIRAIGLELERIANHTGDLGALAGDVGFLPTASYCGRLRGDILNLTALLCGNRFGRGLVVPGGVAYGLDGEQAGAMRTRLLAAMRDIRGAAKLLFTRPSVLSRFEGTGVVDRHSADHLGLVGPAGRASGLEIDVRRDLPHGAYRDGTFPLRIGTHGDVMDRARQREAEIDDSSAWLEQWLEQDCRATPVPADAAASLRGECLAVAFSEGWRGRICHAALTDPAGRFASYKIVDPSFHNWSGLAMALRGGQISDFPLCNKSFNLSYCGFDL